MSFKNEMYLLFIFCGYLKDFSNRFSFAYNVLTPFKVTRSKNIVIIGFQIYFEMIYHKTKRLLTTKQNGCDRSVVCGRPMRDFSEFAFKDYTLLLKKTKSTEKFCFVFSDKKLFSNYKKNVYK